MSRLGPWTPANADERLDRLESLAAIQQLAARYGLAVDSRDMDALVDLFVPDVRVSRDEHGRDALKAWYTTTLLGAKTSVHFVANHIVDFDDADHARGIVYCRDEIEVPGEERWAVGMIQYWDRYVRVDGEWCFERRKLHRWYMVDALTRPSHGAGVDDQLSVVQLPEAFESWGRFWAEATDATDVRG
jgi:hypothetical protein